jgi:gamma-glutamylcyclotransferase (GGCT)/AIG2-like uncharacterized protein YtfP
MTMTRPLYFAYGSNLNRDDWHRWCDRNGFGRERLRLKTTAVLPDHDLVFSYYSGSRRGGVLDLAPRTGQIVEGAIFEVVGDGWRALDRKEGAPDCYERVDKVCLDTEGREILVKTYRVRAERRDEFVRPSPEYVSVVRDGLEHYGLSDAALEAAAEGQRTPWLVDALFAYGTLMRGESRFPCLKPFGLQCTLLAETYGRLADLGTFPALLEDRGHDRLVQGDFLRLERSGPALELLDRVEGFQGFGAGGSLFRRTLTEVAVGDGRVRRAWVYRLANVNVDIRFIDSDDWREHRTCRADFLQDLVRAHTGGGDDTVIALGLASLLPYSFGGEKSRVARSLLPLCSALARGEVSERRLAQVSGSWVTIPA